MLRNMMRVAIVGVGLVTFGSVASAATVISQFFPGEGNLLSDNSAEFLFKAAAGANYSAVDPRYGFLDKDDLLITVFNIETIEDQTGGGGTRQFGSGGVNEFTGLSAIKVASKVGVAAGKFEYEFVPLTAADKALIAGDGSMPGLSGAIAAMAPGAMIALFDDATPNFTRTFTAGIPGPDDGFGGAVAVNPPNGDKIGGPFGKEDAVAATALDGTKILEFGFTGGPGEFWEAGHLTGGVFEDIKVIAGLPTSFNAGTVNFGLNVITNSTGYVFDPVKTFNPVTISFVFPQMGGNATLRGVGDTNTPFDAFDDLNATILPRGVPEPASVAVWSIIAMFCGFQGLRRKSA